MKKILMLGMFLVLVLQMSAFGQTNTSGRDFGLGLEFGDYPGVVAKVWVGNVNAVSAGVGFGSLTRLHLDYLWHDFNVFKVNEGRMPLYYGFGGIMNTFPSASANFGVRGTFGVSYIFKENNFDIFFELSPTFRFDPASGLFLSGSIGVRYFFL